MPRPADPLAYLGFQLIAPDAALRPYIASYWCFRRSTPLTIWHDEYMHPTGGYGLVFNFGDPVRLDGQPVTTTVFLDGSNTLSRKMGFFGRVDLLGIRFQEGGAYPFLALPLAEVQNEIALLDAADARSRPALIELYARLHETDLLLERVHRLDQWLLNRLAAGKTRDPLIPATLAILRSQRGDPGEDAPLMTPDLAELARRCGISQRQLERLYQSQVGMTPKQYTRLLRVETARLALKRMRRSGVTSEAPATTTALAVELGFYDQAHFIRDFSAVVGMTPYRYLLRSQQKREPESSSSISPEQKLALETDAGYSESEQKNKP